ncbi:MAG: transcription-repair coupling factor [Cyanobacteriota bacterium SKYGB_h_bin112]|nr:transcription-repair coupling factor [Cyanobacteriota bacterium SKYGB_h_bin112]
MAFSALVRSLSRSPLTGELLTKLNHQHFLKLTGASRLPKGIIATTLAQTAARPLVVITATLEEAGRWAAQLESMGWETLHFYPTSEASPYEPFDPEAEMVWGQLQVLADLVTRYRLLASQSNDEQDSASPDLDNKSHSPSASHGQDTRDNSHFAIVTTERALQPHLPPVEAFCPFCLTLKPGTEMDLGTLSEQLAQLGYDRVATVETEGQWSRRGDIVDVFPVSAELPVRLEWFGDELDKLREFDPASQRSLDNLDRLILTPTSFTPIITAALRARQGTELMTESPSPMANQSGVNQSEPPSEGMRRYLGLAFEQPASLLDYLPANTLIAIDEPDQCKAHSDRWFEHVDEHYREVQASLVAGNATPIPQIHRSFQDALVQLASYPRLHLHELSEDSLPTSHSASSTPPTTFNLAARAIPTVPHQFARLAEAIRQERDRGFANWIISLQPSRSVALLQEHDCPAQFVPNVRDYGAIDKLQAQRVPVALKYSGLAELEGFVMPTFRVMVVTDKEFYGQHSLATPGYVRKRRRAVSKQVDPNKLRPGDFVVHRNHGVGKFLRLESLTINNQTREYLVIQYADGLLRVVADQLNALSRFRGTTDKVPELNRMTGTAWEKTKAKVRKSIKKLAVDLLQLYAQRSQQRGFVFPPDVPWQQELEDSFPYQPTPDQLKAIQDVKRDMESDRPMDRLVCGDVGFGKTEVALRAIFKAVMGGKQVALLAPTTILTQQHYHTLKERFAPYPIQVALLNRFRTAEERKQIVQKLATGEIDVVVGTHQLLGKDVRFRQLGLLVVDEEQRFGVNQKEKIKAMKTEIDVLTLSATPIPRTLYMALSGVREMSLITTPPPSRRPIKTHLTPYEPETIRSAIRQELDRGGQIFYVVPRVEGIEEVAARLREMVPGLRLAIAHGQMPEAELESTMLSFSNHEADLLLCTTIIESGLDIPRVNTIIIEDAQKFGLSQLYQLRGRVGRAGIQAHAWLCYPSKGELSDAARQRLRAIQEFTQLGSGFQLAMRDMEIRGVGNLLGAEQSGQMDAIGFDLYMQMLQEALQEIRGQEIPKVDDTQIDLNLTAFIPADYIPDPDEKLSAYRAVATAQSKQELTQLAADWSDRYGTLPSPVVQLIRIVELKQIAKGLGFSRIKPDGNQHIVLETPMEEPAWKLLQENLPANLQSRFVYTPGKVTVRGLGLVKPTQQLENLIDWLGKLQGALPDITLA